MHEIIETAEAKVAEQFKRVDKIKEYNQEKVLNAFQKYKIGLEHFATVIVEGYRRVPEPPARTIPLVFLVIFA